MSSATAPSPLPVPPAISRARRAGGSPGPHLTGGEARRHGSHAVTQHERPRRGPESCPGRAHSPLCTAVQSLLRCHGNEPLMTGCILQSSTAAAADGRPFRPRRSARRLFAGPPDTGHCQSSHDGRAFSALQPSQLTALAGTPAPSCSAAGELGSSLGDGRRSSSKAPPRSLPALSPSPPPAGVTN